MKLRSRLSLGCAALSSALISISAAQTPPIINSFTVESEVFVGGRGTLLFDVSDAANLEIDQGVGVVNGADARFSQTEKIYIIPRGATWSYLSDGSDLGASDIVSGNAAYNSSHWKHPDFDDSGWTSGQGTLGYGDTRITTDVGYVDVDPEADGDQKNATTYYRREFSISAGEIAALNNLYLELRRDDGAIVYLNGAEITRMNVGDGVKEFDTYTEDLGHSVAGGSGESTYFVCELTPAMLQAGRNTLAIEIHQANDSSSDTGFDLGISQQASVRSSTIFGAGGTWRLVDDGRNLGDAAIVAAEPGFDASNWKHPDYDDGSWFNLAGDFGYDDRVLNEATVLRFGPNEDNADNDPRDKFLAYYFRTTFDVSGSELAAAVSAAAHIRADDGAILYINGVEVARDGMALGEATKDTEAAPDGVNETAYDEFAINPGFLRAGTNTIAVELHQSSATSSDISFDLDITLSDAADVTQAQLPRGSTWKFLDDGGASLNDSSSDIVVGTVAFDASNWKHSSFDDSGWRSGEGELGYGDSGLTTGGNQRQTFTTQLSFGPDPANKYVTTYFRRGFSLSPAALSEALGARMLARVDDGAIIYLNGVEIWRKNLPDIPDPEEPEPGDPVDGTTLANRSNAADGMTSEVVDFDIGLLQAGANTLAVELHQHSVTTSDAVFDMSMEFVVRSADTVTYTLRASNQFGSTVATASATTVPVPATPLYLTSSNGTSVSWIFPEVWSDKQAPHPAAYVAYGQFDSVIRTPLGENDPVFGGESIDLLGASTQLLLVHSGGTAAVPAINLDGGRIVNGSGRDLAIGGVGNSIVVVSDSTIGTNGNGSLTVSADLRGSGAVRVRNGNGAAIFTGDNGGFSGNWLVQGLFSPASPTALGTGNISVVDGGIFDPDIDFLTPLSNSLSISESGTIDLDQTIAFGTGQVSINGNVVPGGVYTGADLDALDFGGIFVDGGGQLFVGPGSPDSDGDGLLDTWELMFFPGLNSTDGSGDADGDGQTDGAEFASGTSPIDPLDALKIMSASQAASGEVTFTWPSKSGVTYGVRFGDLSTWNVIVSGLAGTGAEMSFTDDGSLTGGVPNSDAERHYQVFVE